MESDLIEFLDQKGYTYITIERDIRKVYNLFIYNILYEAENELEYYYLGVYYQILSEYSELNQERYYMNMPC